MTSSITQRGYSRLGLLGNPGDALGGPALAVALDNYWAQATASGSVHLRLEAPASEEAEWESLEALERRARVHGFSGGRPLMMALLARLSRYAHEKGLESPKGRNLALSWSSTIPPRVGLAGSSALLTAALRAVCYFWGWRIPELDQVDILLRCEREDLGIPAGPQDRVAQVFEGVVFLEQQADGRLCVERLDAQALPPLFVAIDEAGAEGTEVVHSGLRARYERGDGEVLRALEQWSALAREGRDLLRAGRGDHIGPLMDRNYDIRSSIMALNARHVAMVEAARRAGAHAKFAGSGGAIVGTCGAGHMESVISALRGYGYTAFEARVRLPEPEG